MPFWKVMFIAHIVLFSFTFCLVGAISWPSRYRLPYLIVNVMFYIIRFVLAIWFMVISYSYILELRQELYVPVDPEARPEIEPASVIPSPLPSGIL
ncbi:hypothetical protein TcWFU_009010 [Taenia crassiceps]|uniref:Uncharacterized protein n=1 Tax=Taenia crassiceps TaxID=6207 RepID=A0ABR4QTC0_9CEST